MDKMRFEKMSGMVRVKLDGGGSQTFEVIGSKAPDGAEALGQYFAEQLAPAVSDVDLEAVGGVEGSVTLRSSGGATKVLGFEGPVSGGLVKSVHAMVAAVAAGTSVARRAKKLETKPAVDSAAAGPAKSEAVAEAPKAKK